MYRTNALTNLARREQVVAGTGVASGGVALFIHLFGLYSLWDHVDALAHLLAGTGVGSLLLAGLSANGMDTSRRRAGLVLAGTLTAALVWEIIEALPRAELFGFPVTLGYHTRFFTPLYVNDTLSDVAIGFVGAFLVVWVVAPYPGDE